VPRYWVDANVFIEAHQKSYPMDIAEGFWKWMSSRVADGTIVCPRMVYQEIAENTDRRDLLSLWFQSRHDAGLCIGSNKPIQDQVGLINAYVYAKYKYPHGTVFAKGADSWVIAHALVDHGIVVTQESNLHPNAKKPRIPDICKAFNVPFMDRLQMLKNLKARF
jgi:Domain of unknown function (DUF4411)